MSVEVLSLAIQSNVPAVWWGIPGVGKTALCANLAAQNGLAFISVSAAYLDPSDVAGIPFPAKEDGLIQRRHDSWVDAVCSQPCLLLIDELNRASRPVMNALLRVLQERLVGDRPLHSGTRLIATANPPSTDRTATDLPSAAANRCLHVEGVPPLDLWVEFMVSQGEAGSLVAAFIKARPQAIDQMPATPTEAGRAWASRRSWHNAARILQAGMDNGQRDLALVAVGGVVGEGIGLEFATFVQSADLPNPADVLADPMGFRLPVGIDKLFATVGACVQLAHKDFTAERYRQCNALLDRLATSQWRDVGAFYVQRLLKGPEQNSRLPAGFMLSTASASAYMATLKAAGMVK